MTSTFFTKVNKYINVKSSTKFNKNETIEINEIQ